MSVIEVVTTNDVNILATLKINGVPITLSNSDVILATLVQDDHKKALIASPVEQSHSTSGADWGHGIVMIHIPAASLVEVRAAESAILEVKHVGLQKTWFSSIKITTGHIPNPVAPHI